MYFDLTDEQQAIRVDGAATSSPPATNPSGSASWPKRARLRAVRLGRRWPSSAGPAWRCRRSGVGRGSGSSTSPSSSRRWATRSPPRRCFSNTIAGLALALCGSDDQRERFLRPLAAGELRGTPALWDAGSPADPGDFTMEGRGRRRRRRPRRRKGPRPRRRQRRLLPRRHRRRPPPPGRGRGRRRDRHRRALDRPHPPPLLGPLRGSQGGRARTPCRLRGPITTAGLPRALRRARRRVDRDRPADDGDGGRVRQRPQAVRPADRLLPGRLPPLRADAAGDGELALRRLRRRLGGRRRARVAAARRLDRQGLLLRRRLARPRRLDPGPRRHRLHLGARPPLLPQARQAERGDLRRRQVAPRTRRRRRPRRRTPPRSTARRAAMGALDRISVAAIGVTVADLEAEAKRAEAAGVECVWAPELFRSSVTQAAYLAGQDREGRRRHRDRLGLHPQPLHRRDPRARHRRDVRRPLPPRPRLRRQTAQRNLAQRRVRQTGSAPARGDRGDAADHATGRQG